MNVESGSAQSNVPVTFGHVFVPGEVVDSGNINVRLSDGTNLPVQIDAKATHGDGSLRHAVITTILPSVGSNSTTVLTLDNVGSGGAGSGTVTLNELLATSFDATISLNVGGATYTASARDFLANNSPTTWLSGPLASEWLVSGPVATSGGTDHPHLSARFHVRAYDGIGSVRVSVTVENNWSFVASPQNFSYDATVSVAGRGDVLTQSNVSHYRQARWRRVFWWGNDPDVEIAHDSAYMASTGAVPTYDSRLNVPESVLSGMESAWSGNKTRLMGAGLIYTFMPDGGGRPDIAPLPRWTARYLLTQDSRAKTSMLGTSEQAGSFGVHYRDRDTDLPVSLDTYPNATIMGNGGVFPGCGGSCNTPYTPDVAHQPSLSYVPYLVTGDYFHLEELQFWANWNLFYWGQHGGSQGLMVFDQIRAQAWGLRTLGHAAYVTPDNHPLKNYFLAKLNNNLSWYDANYSNNPPTQLGYLTNPPDLGVNNAMATWMDDFFTWTVGHLVNLGFAAAQPIFEYKAKFPLGRMTNPDYCWILASTYWTRARDTNTGAPYQTWAEYKESVIRSWDDSSVGPSFGWGPSAFPPNMSSGQEDALIAAQCNSAEMSNILGLQRSDMIGDSWNHEGYPSNLQPAVAIVAERGLPNAMEAWDTFDSRAVKPDSGNYDYNVSPQFAIVPGNVELSGQLPSISLSSDSSSVSSGGSATLTWSVSNADSCSASGGWSGSRPASGSEQVGPLTSATTFTLNCSNQNGDRSASVTIGIDAPGAPSLTFTSSASSVDVNGTVTLTWSAGNVDSCAASGDWSGNKGTSGSESTGPLTAASTFTLECSGAGGNVERSVSVSINTTPGGGTPPTPPGEPPADDDDSSGGGAVGPVWLLLGLLVAASRRRRAAQ
ncbi:MAG: hypothetical protein QNJ14_09290 [Woeseiaceae bacterium]|nr:hypothetical protein [Woeseiaceae bacterium]